MWSNGLKAAHLLSLFPRYFSIAAAGLHFVFLSHSMERMSVLELVKQRKFAKSIQ